MVRGEGILDWMGQPRRPMPKKGEPPIRLKPSTWTRRCTEEECKLCGIRRIRRGTSAWAGTGIYSYLNGARRAPRTKRPPPAGLFFQG